MNCVYDAVSAMQAYAKLRAGSDKLSVTIVDTGLFVSFCNYWKFSVFGCKRRCSLIQISLLLLYDKCSKAK